MNHYKSMFEAIIAHPKYAQGILYGKPRRGHSEGSVQLHIQELDQNLERMKQTVLLSPDEFWKLRVLIHVHDTFKKWATRDCPIDDVNSHATLARKFLSEFTADLDLLRMVQWHDENFALWKQFKKNDNYDHKRLEERTLKIEELDLFVMFTIIDGCTLSKMELADKERPDKLRWFVEELNTYEGVQIPSSFLALEAFNL